jgi:hypothetical protein
MRLPQQNNTRAIAQGRSPSTIASFTLETSSTRCVCVCGAVWFDWSALHTRKVVCAHGKKKVTQHKSRMALVRVCVQQPDSNAAYTSQRDVHCSL